MNTAMAGSALPFLIFLFCGCGGGSANVSGSTQPPAQSAATPTITSTPAQNGAVVVTLADTTAGATIYYTTDGSTPTESSTRYYAPFLVDSNITLNAIAADPPAYLDSKVAAQSFAPNIASGTLVWSDEFSNPGNGAAQPNPSTWTYDTGATGWGNNEPEDYCSWASATSPCNAASPNAFVGTDDYLHIVAQQPSSGTYTSARMKTQGLFSFMYGRIEARVQVPESQGMWPAFWMLGNNIATVNWPACGEADIMEHIDGANPPLYAGGPAQPYDWVQSSVHGTGLNGGTPYHPTGFSAGTWHTYGMIWTKGQVQFYIDDPSAPYETFTPSNISGTWPFDQGPMFILLNLAVGGNWPGNPDSTTVFPSTYFVDYVRIYKN